MGEFSYDEAFRMVSLFKGQIRSVKDDTAQIMADSSIDSDEKLEKLSEIELNCVENIAAYADVSREFILGLHRLLTNYKVGDDDRKSAYSKFLVQHVNGNIEEILDFMNSELLGEYDHAIRRHKVLLEIILGDRDND